MPHSLQSTRSTLPISPSALALHRLQKTGRRPRPPSTMSRPHILHAAVSTIAPRTQFHAIKPAGWGRLGRPPPSILQPASGGRAHAGCAAACRVLYGPHTGKCCKGWGHAGCAAATLWRAAAPVPAQPFASAARPRPTGRPPRCCACAARSAARSLQRPTGASGTARTRAEGPPQKSSARAAALAAGAATARPNAACAARTLPSSGLPAGPGCSARRHAASTLCVARPARARAGRPPIRKNASTSMRAQGCGRRSTGPGTRRNEKGSKSGGRKRGRSAGGTLLPSLPLHAPGRPSPRHDARRRASRMRAPVPSAPISPLHASPAPRPPVL